MIKTGSHGFWSRLFRSVAALAALAMVTAGSLEIYFRIRPTAEIQFKWNEKRVHCLERDLPLVGLCPDVRLRLNHPAGFAFTISTNHEGERWVPAPRDSDRKLNRRPQEASPGNPGDTMPAGKKDQLWILGDSIAMGYGIDDGETVAARIANNSSMEVHNLGVDGLGAVGIKHRLRVALDRYDTDGSTGTIHAVWIFHPSDFVDDPRDLSRIGSPLKGGLFRLHFFLSKESYLYNALRSLMEKMRLQQRDNSYNVSAIPLPAADHPTYRAMEETIKLARSRKVDLILLIYPDLDRTTGKPEASSPVKSAVHQFFKERGIPVIDMFGTFRSPSGDVLYLPDDGHPTGAGANLMAKAVLAFLQHHGEIKP